MGGHLFSQLYARSIAGLLDVRSTSAAVSSVAGGAPLPFPFWSCSAALWKTSRC